MPSTQPARSAVVHTQAGSPVAMTDAEPTDGPLLELLSDWLPHRRWFPFKGVDARLSVLGGLTLLAPDPDPQVRVRILLVQASAAGRDVLLQVPVTMRGAAGPVRGRAGGGAGPTPAPDPSWIGTFGEPPVTVRDGCDDSAFLRAWLAASEGTRLNLDLDDARALTGEQSNTSVVLHPPTTPDVAGLTPDDDPSRASIGRGSAILKVFRTITPGGNPDIDVPRALADAGWAHVPRPLRWLTARWPTGVSVAQGHLAVLSEFVDGAQDGFELAVAMARRGDPFVDRARELGAVVAAMHEALSTAMPVVGVEEVPVRARALAEAVTARFRWACEGVPELRGYAVQVARLVHQVEELPLVPQPQRIHGDLHLGQCLRARERWYVTDFEGEPLAPISERTRPDLALRDIAGMLRSFDYAATVALDGERDATTGRQWSDNARRALLEGYLHAVRDAWECREHGVPAQPSEADMMSRVVLLRALELDKALYEAVYEARNRPSWLPIPLSAIERLLR